MPISSTLGSQASLTFNPRKEGDNVAFTLQAENTLARPVQDGPVYADDTCKVAVYLIDSVLLPKIVYGALGITASAPTPATSISG